MSTAIYATARPGPAWADRRRPCERCGIYGRYDRDQSGRGWCADCRDVEDDVDTRRPERTTA